MGRLATSLFAILALVFLSLENRGFAAPAPISGFANSPSLYASQAGPKQWMPLTAYYTGQGKLSYRWYRDGRLLKGFKGKELRVGTTSLAQEGVYTVDITDSADGVTVRKAFFVKLAAPKGYLIGLGDNSHGQADIPASLLPPTLIHAFAAGGTHSLAVSDGWIYAWGDNSAGQATVPYQGNKRSYTVAAGARHSLALLEDGTVRAWGDNSSGQCDVPASLGVVRAIAAGGGHSLAIRLDDTVVGWGETSSGQLTVPEFSSIPVAIAAGHDHSLALLANGEVVAWGANDYGQSEVPPKLKNIVSIGAAGDASFAITRAGRVHLWGDTSFKQAPAPTKLKPVASAAGGWDFIAARLGTGRLSFWGDGAESLVAQSNGLARIYALAAGGGHVLALRDGKTDKAPRIISAPVSSATTWDQPTELTVSAEGNQLSYQWYHNGQPILGATQPTYRIDRMRLEDVGAYSVRVLNGFAYVHTQNVQLSKPGAIPVLIANRATTGRQRLEVGDRLRIEVSAEGAGNVVYQWRHNGKIIPSETNAVLERTIASTGDAGVYVAEIRDEGAQVVFPATCVVVPPSEPVQIVTWGDGSYGQTQPPEGIDDAIAAAAGAAHSLVLRSDGTIVAWGDNRAGQCTVPNGLAEVVAIAAEGDRSAALTAEGVIWTWGGGQAAKSTHTGRNDLTRIGLSSAGVHAFSDATAQNPSTAFAQLSEAAGNAVIYRMTEAGQLSAETDSPVLGFDAPPALLSKARSVGAKSVTVTMPDITWSHVPTPNTAGFVYEPYKQGSAFSAVSGHVSVLTAGGVARFWDTEKFFAYDIPNYSIARIVSYRVTRPSLDRVSRLTSGGDFRVFVRTDGGVGGFGENPREVFAGIPWRLNGVRALVGGERHVIALCEGPKPDGPRIVSAPKSRGAVLGESIRLRVKAEGTHLRYQWHRNGQALAGAVSDTLELGAFAPEKAGDYSVRVSDGFASVETAAAAIFAAAAPVFAQAPTQRLGLREGDRLELAATVEAIAAVSYQWLKDGLVLAGETSATLIRDAVTVGDAGRYTLRVTTAEGAVARASSHVFVLPKAGTRLVQEDEAKPYPAGQAPWAAITDAVDFLPTWRLALRLDGTVASWGEETPGVFQDWRRSLTDVVALSEQAVLRADGTLSARPGRTLPDELSAHRVVSILPGRSLVFMTEEGRVGLIGEYASTVQWLPSVEAPAWFGQVRFELERAVGVHASVYESDCIVIDEDGAVATSLTPGLFAIDPAVRPVRALTDLDGGFSVISAEGTVHAATHYGLQRSADPSLADVRETQGSGRVHIRLHNDGSLRRWTRADYDKPWEETAINPLQGRVVLKARIGNEKVMALCVADESFARASFSISRQVVVAGTPLILEPAIEGGQGLSFIWEHNGRRIVGAYSPRLERDAASAFDAGWYRVRISDASGLSVEAVTYVQVTTPGARLESAKAFVAGNELVSMPSPALDNVVDFISGVAVRADGTLATWASWPSIALYKVPAGLTEIVRVSEKDGSACALDSSGRATVWKLSTGMVQQTWGGVLWLQSEFMLMRDGSVRTFRDGKLVYPTSEERGAVVDITRGVWNQRTYDLLLRQDGALLVLEPRPYPYTASVWERAQLGGVVADMRIHFYYGLDILIATDGGGRLRLRSNQPAVPSSLRLFDDERGSLETAINFQNELIGSQDAIVATGVIKSRWPWFLRVPAEGSL